MRYTSTMCPERIRRRQAGFALMAALFIIVTLAAIGAYLLTVSHGQVAAATQDEQAARAYQAARAGIEWGAYQVLIVSPPNCPGLPAPQSVNVPEQSQTYVAVVTCEVSDVETEGAQQITTYKVTATGCNVGG